MPTYGPAEGAIHAVLFVFAFVALGLGVAWFALKTQDSPLSGRWPLAAAAATLVVFLLERLLHQI